MENLKRLLGKYSKGEISLKEMIELTDQMNDEKSKKVEKMLLEDWEEHMQADGAATRDLKLVLHKVHHRIHLSETQRFSPFKRWWMGFQRVAAILIIPLIAGFIVLLTYQTNRNDGNRSFAEIQCPMGVRTKFILPDGTSGYLNSGSTLRYPVLFGKERRVELTGVAYFDIFYEANKPFHVITKNLDIESKGDVVNVIANDKEETEEVVMQIGKVNVNRNNGQLLAVLSANEQLIFDIEKQAITTFQVDASAYSAWKDGKLVFNNENIHKVASRLSRWYNAEIILTDNQPSDQYQLQATFIDEPLEEVLKIISDKTKLIYKEEKRSANAYGVYNKRKITVQALR